VVDTSDLSLEEYVFASKTRKAADAIYKIAPSAFASTAWFHGLKLLSGTDTNYRLAKHLFPDATSDERRSHLKMLRSHRNGQRSPRGAKLAAFEKLVPGSRAFLEMPCWEGMRPSTPKERRMVLMSKLAPDIQRIAWRGGHPSNGFPVLSHRDIHSVTRHASPDGLACITMLMLDAVEVADAWQAFRLSAAVCQVLLLVAPWLKAVGVLRPVGDYYEQHLLPLAGCNGQRYSFNGKFVENAIALARDGFFEAAARFDDNKMRSVREVIDCRLLAFNSPIARGKPYFLQVPTSHRLADPSQANSLVASPR
jgi:hypothetical protein